MDPHSQNFPPKIAVWISAGWGRRAEAGGRESRWCSVLVDGPSARTRSSRRSAQTHHCGNPNASVRPDLPGPGRRSVASPASVHGSSRRLLNSPTRCSILHLRFKPWGDDRRPQLTGKCLRKQVGEDRCVTAAQMARLCTRNREEEGSSAPMAMSGRAPAPWTPWMVVWPRSGSTSSFYS